MESDTVFSSKEQWVRAGVDEVRNRANALKIEWTDEINMTSVKVFDRMWDLISEREMAEAGTIPSSEVDEQSLRNIQMDVEKEIGKGDIVMAFWTRPEVKGIFKIRDKTYSGKAKVRLVYKDRIRLELIEDVPPYRAGYRFVLPRSYLNTWNINNRFEQIEGYEVIADEPKKARSIRSSFNVVKRKPPVGIVQYYSIPHYFTEHEVSEIIDIASKLNLDRPRMLNFMDTVLRIKTDNAGKFAKAGLISTKSDGSLSLKRLFSLLEQSSTDMLHPHTMTPPNRPKKRKYDFTKADTIVREDFVDVDFNTGQFMF